MRILLIGGNGFIGSHIVRKLLADGHEIVVLDKYPEKYFDPVPEVNFWRGSISDKALLTKALNNVDLVFHLVSTTVPGTSNLDVETDVTDNLLSTLGLLEMMRKLDVPKLVFLSSGGAVYGNPATNPVIEEAPLNPISSYGINKMAIEKYMELYQSLHGIQSVILRPSNPYGPGQSTAGVQGVIGRFLYQALKKKPIEIWGDGEVVRDYIFIDDLVEICAALTSNFQPGVYNVGSGVGTSINEIIPIIESATNQQLEVVRKPGRPSDVKAIVLDCEKARQTFNWQANYSLLEGVRQHWSWMKTLSGKLS